MIEESGETGLPVQLGDGRKLFLRAPRAGDIARLPALYGVPFAYFASGRRSCSAGSICSCAGPCEQRDPLVIAALEGGQPVAAAWLHQDPRSPHVADFSLAIQPAFNRAGIAPALLRALADQAGVRGVRRICSNVGRGTRDPLSDCRAAFLPIVSAMNFGGVTEVVLGTPAARALALA